MDGLVAGLLPTLVAAGFLFTFLRRTQRIARRNALLRRYDRYHLSKERTIRVHPVGGVLKGVAGSTWIPDSGASGDQVTVPGKPAEGLRLVRAGKVVLKQYWQDGERAPGGALNPQGHSVIGERGVGMSDLSRQTCILAIPLELPYGTLESRSLLGRLAGTGGLLTADETFDRAYHISGEGEWLLRMTDEVRRAFLSLGHLEPMFSNGHLLVQLEQDSQDVGETIEQVIRLAELLSDDRSDIELAAQAIAHSEDEAFVERLLRWTFEAGLQGQVLADAAQARLDHFLHRADDTPSLDARLLVRYFAERPMGELVALLTLNSRYPLDARLLAVEAVKRRGLRGEPASEDLLVPFRKLIGADQANEVLLAIMRALREMGKPVPYSVLSMAFEHARGTFGVGVVQEVLRRERDDCELVLCRLAGADDVAVSLAAVEALTGIGTETCVSVLLQLKEEVGTGVFAHDGLVNALETALIVVRSRLVGREAGRLSVYDDADPGALSITDPNEG